MYGAGLERILDALLAAGRGGRADRRVARRRPLRGDAAADPRPAPGAARAAGAGGARLGPAVHGVARRQRRAAVARGRRRADPPARQLLGLLGLRGDARAGDQAGAGGGGAGPRGARGRGRRAADGRRPGLPMVGGSAPSGMELPVVDVRAAAGAARGSTSESVGGAGRRTLSAVGVGGHRRWWSPTSTGRCSPTATAARAAAARSHDGRLVGGRAVLPATARGRSSCRARAARWTTSACSSSRCRCCARRRREGGAGGMSADGRPAAPARRRLDDAVAARRRAGSCRPARLARTAARGPRAGTDARPTERCDLCGIAIPEDHRHLLQLVGAPDRLRVRGLLGDALGRGRLPADRQPDAVARRAGRPRRSLGELPDPDRAGVLHASRRVTGCVVAMYPSPAGATESELHFESWSRMLELNPVLDGLEPDIEGLIVNRLVDPPVYVIAPIDRCYELTGTSRRAGRGSPAARGVERGGRASSSTTLRARGGRRRERASPAAESTGRASTATRPEPEFAVLGARPVRYAAAPMLTLDLQVTETERAPDLHDRADDPADDRARAPPLRRRDARAAGRAVRCARAVGGDDAQPRVVASSTCSCPRSPG